MITKKKVFGLPISIMFMAVVIAAAMVAANPATVPPAEASHLADVHIPCLNGTKFKVTQTPGDHGYQGAWDVVCNPGTVDAPVAGWVMFTQNSIPESVIYKCASLGNVVWIRGVDGIDYAVGHLKQGSARVQKGQWVDQGTPIATQGQSGLAYGVHVHFQRLSQAYTYKDCMGNTVVWGTKQPMDASMIMDLPANFKKEVWYSAW